MKLSKAQQAIYDELKSGEVAHYMHGLNSYWFMSGSLKNCTQQIRKLMKLGLLDVTRDTLGYYDEARAKPQP